MLYIIRMILMAIHFVFAGIINLILCVFRPFNPDNSRLVARVYSLPAIKILGLTVQTKTEDLKSMPQDVVYVANHQSNFDLFIVGLIVPKRTVTIGKDVLKWVPFFGQIFWLAGNLLIHRGHATKAKETMTKTTQVLQTKNTSIWIFAEGTRNKGKGLLPFKKGAFIMAVEAQVPIVMICTSSYKRDWNLNKWNSSTIKIESLPPIPTKGLTLNDIPQLMEKCHLQMKEKIDSLDSTINQ